MGLTRRGSTKRTIIFKNISRKITGNLQYFEYVHESLAGFDWENRILIKSKGGLMEIRKVLIIIIEIKKDSGRFLSVWVKNQLGFEILRKF